MVTLGFWIALAALSTADSRTLPAVPDSRNIPNWEVPATWTPLRPSGFFPMTDVSSALPFVAITPCRIADTRGLGFSGQAGPPALSALVARTFQITGTVPGVSTQCGIPTGADAVSFQFTIVTPSSDGNLIAWPGGPAPSVSVLNWSAGTVALGNGTIVPLSASGALSVAVNAAGGATAHLVIDVNGYFSDSQNPGRGFRLFGSLDEPLILAENASTGPNAQGIRGSITSAGAAGASVAVRGIHGGTGSSGVGVWGSHAGEGWGVFGEASSGRGVFGLSGSGPGVVGFSTSGRGVDATSLQNSGVVGFTQAPFGFTAGVFGESLHPGAGVHFGVRGVVHSTGTTSAGVSGYAPVSSGIAHGVAGQTDSTDGLAAGVYGAAAAEDGNGGYFQNLALGAGVDVFLAAKSGLGLNHSILALGRIQTPDLGAGTVNAATVFTEDLFASDTKNFVSPHPDDPALEIQYSAVEAPTVDVYFRGSALLTDGFARVEIPDHFRMTAREGTYMTTLTAVGQPALLHVEEEGPGGLVVRGDRDVRFHYVVHAERAEIDDFRPFVPNVHFTPEALMLRDAVKSMRGTTKALLIRNGTLDPDGTFNEETARRLGWKIPQPRTGKSSLAD
jgi:hypothetical protein